MPLRTINNQEPEIRKHMLTEPFHMDPELTCLADLTSRNHDAGELRTYLKKTKVSAEYLLKEYCKIIQCTLTGALRSKNYKRKTFPFVSFT